MDRNWSTQVVDARASGDVWRDAVGADDRGIETRVRRPLSGVFATRAVAGFKLVRFKSTGHAIVGSEPGRSDGSFLVSLQLGGGARLTQNRRAVEVGAGAGAVGLVDLARPFELSFPSEVERVFLFIPNAVLRARVPWLAQANAASLARDNPAARIIAEYMQLVGDPHRRLDDTATLILLDGFLGALAAAGALQRREDGRDRAKLRLDALKAYARCRLADAALSPGSVARAFGLSARTLHTSFERIGTTFRQWLLSERLEACAAALDLPASDARIAHIALAAGFGDISYFNRCFKARFGMTPRQWRRREPGR